ncbi:TetR/AcrR family transcriptional regulator [Mycolicibacterium moriokaense]|uniref:TetR/AcrR family transcriptional regulator n=1 Tax=Mycolicibacterium moriokaense TaxID=39691 RepID=UPI000D75B035|nr:TetR/AcrR family transcriptional regulator [Mycolicibacterium moriokaense]
MTPTRSRRTQGERTAATRAALLDATLDALVEVGFKGTTTTEVARRAGVSAGALQGHFPTKSELLAAAVTYSLDRRVEEFGVLMAGLDPAADKLDEAIDLLWSMFCGSTYTSSHELWVAARTDPELAPAVIDTDRKFAAACAQVFAQVFSESDFADTSLNPAIGLQMVFALMNGLALSRSIDGYESLATDEILDAFKTLVRPLLTTKPNDYTQTEEPS